MHKNRAEAELSRSRCLGSQVQGLWMDCMFRVYFQTCIEGYMGEETK